MVQVSAWEWLAIGFPALLLGGFLVWLAYRFRRPLRRVIPRSDAGLGAVNAVIGIVIALAAVPSPWGYVIALAVFAIGATQVVAAERVDRRRRRQLKNDFQRRLTVLYFQLHKLWQPIHNRVILNDQALRIAKANSDPSLVAQLQAERVKIELAKDEAVTTYRIDFSPEVASLPHEIYNEFSIDPSGVLDIIGDHHWNASFDDINKIGEAIRALGERLYNEE